jgi:hypothetical protein
MSEHPRRPHAGNGALTSGGADQQRRGSTQEVHPMRGTIWPQTHFQIRLPTTRWHGQYLQEGCSDLCGRINPLDLPLVGFGCAPATHGELVLVADDGGHTGGPTDGRWGKDDPELRRVFGLTSEHSVSRLSRAVIARFYGRPPTQSYFDGCSTSGRQALILAQRYPTDFDGIIAGAPLSNLAPLALLNAWEVRHNTNPDGHQVRTAEKLPALHAAVMRRCAGGDGLIADPRRCDFQPATIQCPRVVDAAWCLTPAQVRAVRAFYRGPTDPAGRSLYNGGQPYGSELGGFAASQRFSRLYLIPGGYHCLFGPNSGNPAEVAVAELLTPLMDWAERGVAPDFEPAPIFTRSDPPQLLVDQTVGPYDALAAVEPAPGSLNGHYDYIGHYRPERP